MEKRVEDVLEPKTEACVEIEVSDGGAAVGRNVAVRYIHTDEIMPNRAQPRRVFDNESLWKLAENIKMHGILQPITVKKCVKSSEHSIFKYELIAGERRLRASRLIGMTEVPCILLEIDEKESAELAIIENLHREDLNMFEEAAAIAALIDLHSLTQEEIAERLSVTQAAVANKLRLLRLTEAERAVILANGMAERHARALLRIKDGVLRSEVLGHIAANGLNVKQAEQYIERVIMPDQVAEVRKRGYKGYIDTIRRAVEGLRSIGGEAKTACAETKDAYVYTITIRKEVCDGAGAFDDTGEDG